MDLKTIIAINPTKEKDGVLYFSEPPLDIEPSRDQNPTDKRTWSYWRTQNFYFFKKELADMREDSILIDLGAGRSDFSELTKRFNLCAVDFYPYPGIHVICDLENTLPFKDGSADILLLSNLLEHVREPNVLLKECYRILKPGGVMLGTVPFMIQIHQRPHDFYRYTDTNLKYLFGKRHFKNTTITAVNNLYILLFNTTTSFFVSLIREARFKLPPRILWKVIRVGFSMFRGVSKKRLSDSDNPLGYLFKAYKAL